MLILTDRFFVTFFHVKYYQRCKPSTTKMVICVTVLYAVLTAIPPLVIYFNGMYQLYQLYVELYEYVYCGTEWFILFMCTYFGKLQTTVVRGETLFPFAIFILLIMCQHLSFWLSSCLPYFQISNTIIIYE